MTKKKKTEGEKLVKEATTDCQNTVKTALTEGHAKLAVQENELPSNLLAPYKTIKEKVESLVDPEEVRTFKNNLLNATKQVKKQKLTNIINHNINQIKKAVGDDKSIQLGKANQDYENLLKGMVNPDDIERKTVQILKIIEKQKAANKSDQNDTPTPQETPEKSKWPKVLGIIALITVPIVVLALVIVRVRKKRKSERLEKEK